MATTIQLQNTLNWVAAFIVQRLQAGVQGVANEPFLTGANKIMQTILAPPFKWSWNRRENSSIVCTPGVADYVVSGLNDWGWIEAAEVFVTGGTPPVFEIQVSQMQVKETNTNRPSSIVPILDDNAGNITFRLTPAPDLAYPITFIYQKAAITASSLTGTWAPIPDRYAFLYEQGMLGLMQGMYNTQLYMANMEMFFRQLVGAAEGLTDTEKAIFLEDQLRILRTGQSSGIAVTQGKQARF
ncbi:MAG: hypothetical protein ACYDHE_11300 [Candidatus Acidiferrales bacterium]